MAAKKKKAATKKRKVAAKTKRKAAKAQKRKTLVKSRKAAPKRKTAVKAAPKRRAPKRKAAPKRRAPKRGAPKRRAKKRKKSALQRSRTRAQEPKRRSPRKSAPKKKAVKAKRRLVSVPKQRPAPAPKNVYVIRSGDPRGYVEGHAGFEDRVRKPSHFNSSHNHNFEQAFEAFFTAYAVRAGAGDPDYIALWRYGVSFRSENNFNRDEVLSQVRAIEAWLLQNLPPDWVTHVVDEGTNITVHIGLGSADESRSMSQAVMQIQNARRKLVHVQEMMNEITVSDCDWFTFADIPLEWDVESE